MEKNDKMQHEIKKIGVDKKKWIEPKISCLNANRTNDAPSGNVSDGFGGSMS